MDDIELGTHTTPDLDHPEISPVEDDLDPLIESSVANPQNAVPILIENRSDEHSSHGSRHSSDDTSISTTRSTSPQDPQHANGAVPLATVPSAIVPSATVPSATVPSAAVQQAVLRERRLPQELKAWWGEMLACILLLSMLTVIALTIYFHRGQPLPQWPLGITINALLSFYSVIYKTAIVYVIGSSISQSQWLWFSKEQRLSDISRYSSAATNPGFSIFWALGDLFSKLKRPLASFGGILLLVTVIIDPFIQQLVQFVGCSITLDHSSANHSSVFATLPRTNFFDPGGLSVGHGAPPIPLTSETNGVTSGMFAPPPDVDFDCNTGNCTFSQSFSTVGFCSQCEDRSDSLQLTYTPYSVISSPPFDSVASLPEGFAVHTTSDTFGFSRSANRVPTVNVFGGFSGIFGNITVLFSSLRDDENNTVLGVTYNGPYALDWNTFSPMSGCNPILETESQDWSCRGYGAATCTLLPCVRTYNSTVSNGRLSETLLSVANFGPFDPSDLTVSAATSRGVEKLLFLVDTQCTSDKDNAYLQSQGYSIEPESRRWLPVNLTMPNDVSVPGTGVVYPVNISEPIASNASYPASLIATDCVYMISQNFVVGFIENFYYTLFTGNITGQIRSFSMPTLSSYTGPEALLRLYNSGYSNFSFVESVFSNAATSMTNHIRQNGDAIFSKPLIGTVNHVATCIHVQWAWFALPASLTAFSIVLLVISIIINRKQEAPLWKDSQLALIFHGPQSAEWTTQPGSSSPANSQRPVQLDTISDMEKFADTIIVSLDWTAPLGKLSKTRYMSRDTDSGLWNKIRALFSKLLTWGW
jgi:hypothetical protein